jgi:hypothetical protein
MKYSSHNNSGHSLLAFVAGATMALVLGGYYLFGPRGRENHEKVSRWMLRAKRDILAKMETIEDLTEDKYNTIVDEVTGRYSKMKHIGGEKAAQAAGTFKEKWEDMRDMVAEAREEAEREITEKEIENVRKDNERPSM